ncbi:AraC family transcriptional regulator [Exilibacterium tricleocarpae]|uniref:AraC family transcriptional regulator n=1 Tax=Exilibacterium tricleocarpae TaxID=2591008 RepID=A0A545TLP2_9GAMM|nr:AraC family transcriptional regulator [Exilibacterium tricleocarpae]TQV78139.1 AraC family transcriptional regulator [Exilibacterium tricleocarpae]
MTPDTTSVPTAYAQSLIDAARQQGCDVDSLLDELDIARTDIDTSLHFSAVKYGQLYQRVMRVMQDECFGMFVGGRVRLGSFRLMCLTVLHCSDLRQAMVRAGEFSEICRGMRVRSQLQVDESKNLARVQMAPIRSVSQDEFETLQALANPNQIRTSLAVWHRFNCWLIGQEIPLASLHFSFPCPEEFRELAESYPATLKFEQAFNGFEFPLAYLDYPIVQNQETLEDFLRSAPYHLVINDSAQHSVKGKVRAILSKDVSHTMPGAEEVASRLNLSVTTLRRKLQSENTSYQKLKDECRMEAAFHYLGCPDFTNGTIAERLGFDETSAFFRAFKKWTGITPGEYRRGLLN